MCPWEGCGGSLEFWEEQIFDSTFLAMGCTKCPGLWFRYEDAGEWLCSMGYVEWRSRVHRQEYRVGNLGRLGDGRSHSPD